MKILKEINLSNKHYGQSDIFLVQNEYDEEILIKQYPAFSVEEIRLYNKIQNYLSKFSIKYNENKDAIRKISWNVLKSVTVKVLPLDSNNVKSLKPYNKTREITTLLTSSFPEYVPGKTMYDLIEEGNIKYIFARHMCWDIESALKNIIAPANYWSINRITIDPLNVKVKHLWNWEFEFIITDIAADMLRMIYGTHWYVTKFDVQHLKEEIDETIYTTLADRKYVPI